MNGELSAARFAEHIWESGIVDPEGVHHVLNSGMHGRKADFDAIVAGTELWDEWVNITAQTVIEYPQIPKFLLSVANGTNRLVRPVAEIVSEAVGQKIKGLETTKSPGSDVIRLTPSTWYEINTAQPDFVLILKDAGTTGGSALQVARLALKHGAQHVEVLDALQWLPEQQKLDAAKIAYQAIVKANGRILTPKECHKKGGMCANKWQLLPKGEAA